MIKKRSLTNGVNANVSLEPSAASQSTSNISNNIIINKRDDGKEDIVITRDVELEEPEVESKALKILNATIEKKRGRKSKYNNDEERKEARRKQQREYREREKKELEELKKLVEQKQ